MAQGQEIMLRLTIEDPLPGVAYSLQDKKSQPVGSVVSADAPLSFDVPIRLAEGPRFLGEHVRSEGPTRRFVYIAVGAYAGDPASPWAGRVKVDIHNIPAALLGKAVAGAILEVRLPGRGANGGPAYATAKPLGAWEAVA